MKKPIWYTPVWKDAKSTWGNKLHSICSYLAMFPPALPYYFIKQFTNPGDVVFDPFSGRGTAPLEACLNGRVGIGNDLNPLAQVLTGAKVNVPSKIQVIQRIEDLEREYSKPDVGFVDDDIRMLFDEEVTLPMLVYLRNELDRKCHIDCFILALIVGIMHGKWRKDGTSMYLSIDMPNTFSMSPNYIRKYVDKHQLTKIKQNVFKLLKLRVESILGAGNELSRGICHHSDAIDIAIDPMMLPKSVDLIITSPPYLKVIKYGKYNWIRLWMLGKDSDEVDKSISISNAYKSGAKIRLSDNMKKDEYLEFMSKVILSWERILKDDGMAVIVIGDVEIDGNPCINLAEEVWEYAKAKGSTLKCEAIIHDEIKSSKKVTKIWGGNKRGNATKVDRIIVLSNQIVRSPKYKTKAKISAIFS